jgi:SOS-response transcriptional repressor LexA
MDSEYIQQRFRELKKQRVYPSGRWLVSKMPKLSKYMINKILTGQVFDAEDERVFRSILDQIGITEDEFFGRPSAPKASTTVETPSAPSKVPLYGDIPAGYATPAQNAVEPEEWVDAPPQVKIKNPFALRVTGYSMAPRLLPGDLVYLEKLNLGFGYKDLDRPAPRKDFEKYNGRIVAALVDGEAQLKALKVLPKKDSLDFDLFLVSLNSAFAERYIQPNECLEIQGVVVANCRSELLPVINLAPKENAWPLA